MDQLLKIITGRQTDGYLEVRSALPNQRGMAQSFCPVDRPALAAKRIAELATTTDVFIGAAPRITLNGGRAAVPQTWCLWVDCDDEASSQRLREFKPAPTLTIASGSPGRVHAWWALRFPVPALYAEQANRRLAHHLGADIRCAEVARIMRPPGTFNWKTDPPASVTVEATGASNHSVLMVANLPDPPMRRRPMGSVPRRHSGSDPLLGISAQEYIPRLTGRDVDGRGFVQCPYHEDWSPSLMAYAEPKRGWYCFQCGTGGDIFTFGSELWGYPARGAGFTQLKERLTKELL